jgi:hypothetical protein
MQSNNNIFEFLDFILKKKEKEPIYENNITNYILNRWLSMSDPEVARIVNVTGNRWKESDQDSETFLDTCKFYKTLLPKINKKIEYAKKKNLTTDQEFQQEEFVKNYEISKRELKIYDKTLEKIKSKDN